MTGKKSAAIGCVSAFLKPDWSLCILTLFHWLVFVRDDNDEPLFKVDQSKELRLRVTVQNLGEDAHEAAIFIHRPPHVGYIDVDKVRVLA